MIYNIISTGSKGNAIIYHNKIMVDCGLPLKKLEPYLKDIKVILLTHMHKDHFNITTIRKISVLYPDIKFYCLYEIKEYLLNIGINSMMINVVSKFSSYGYQFMIDDVEYSISTVMLYHDVPNVGYRIITKKQGEKPYKIFHATDTVTLDGIEAKGYDLYAIEFNHDEKQIEIDIAEKLEKGVFCYEIGAKESHLSFQKAHKFYDENRKESSELIKLHMSHKYEIQ